MLDFSFPPIPLSGFLCSLFCLSVPLIFLFSFCWFSFTSSFPDALHSGGSGKSLRRGRDPHGMSWREARQMKTLTPNPTQHPHVHLILVHPRTLAWPILPLRRQMMVKPFDDSFPNQNPDMCNRSFQILNWILELIRNPGWMVLYNLTHTLLPIFSCHSFERQKILYISGYC